MPKSILLMDKQAMVIVALKDQTQNWYISSLAKATGTTYVHACNFLAECEKLGIVQSEMHGKLKTVKLTEKGAQVADYISGIYAVTKAQNGTAAQAKEPTAKDNKPKQEEKKTQTT